jgi:hypothetical protein
LTKERQQGRYAFKSGNAFTACMALADHADLDVMPCAD